VTRVPQDALTAFGPQAAHLGNLWNLMLWVCGVVFVAVLLALWWALHRAPRAGEETPADVSPLQQPERRAERTVALAVGASVLGLLGLIVFSVLGDRALAAIDRKGALQIEVSANQWWWGARYLDPDPSKTFETANELHIPVGRPVVLTLTSADVIHSFWVPNIAGKKDLIPGRPNTLAIRADKAGTYRGQCAEFCGLQHARMALVVVADAPDAWQAWAAQQRESASEPADARQARGRQVFLGSTCAMCHNISGTPASARKAPDLTHVGSRRTLAAGTLPNTRDALAEWIADPHAFKPGVNMPGHAFSREDLDALVAYLESLK
jgi:cytochrome c oxidase subunit 2